MSKTNSDRRYFLKTTVATGAALTGGLSVSRAALHDQPEAASGAKKCNFSGLPRDFVYLNSGTEGSMPECVVATFQNSLNQWASDPTTSYETDPVFGKRQELNRKRVGEFLGVGENNICLTDNTTMGLSMTLMGLNFRPGDRVVTTNHEHTAIKSPLSVLQARIGLRVTTQLFPCAARLSGMTGAELLDTLFPDKSVLRGAKALCVSHVYPSTGVRLPLAALREKADKLGIRYLIVDGAQALGMVNLSTSEDNIRNCDFYACPGHKWLNGPPGTGVLYIRNADIRPPEFYPTISQRMEKYTDNIGGGKDGYPVAKALQVRGCSNVPGFAAMISALDFVRSEGGSSSIEKHILGLSREAKDTILAQAPRSIVSPHSDAALLSGLTVFFPFRWNNPEELFTDKKTADWVVSELLKKNIQIRSIGFQNTSSKKPAYALRVSTAYFNTAEQVDMFKIALQEVLRRI